MLLHLKTHNISIFPIIELYQWWVPIMFYKRDGNFCDILVKNEIGSKVLPNRQHQLAPFKKGNFPCAHCSCCNNLIKRDTFVHPHSGKVLCIKQRFSCSYSFVVYAIICPCGLYYIGEITKEMRIHIKKHKSTIRTQQTELPVLGHSVSQLSNSPPKRGRQTKWFKEKRTFWDFFIGNNVSERSQFGI